jgi:hypothetical protein
MEDVSSMHGVCSAERDKLRGGGDEVGEEVPLVLLLSQTVQ